MVQSNNKGSDPEGWNRYQHFILKELESLNIEVKNLHSGLLSVQLTVAGLKVRAGGWGLVAGTIPVAILLGINYLKQ